MAFLERWVRMMDESTMARILANPRFDEKCELLHVGDCNVKACIQFGMGVQSLFKTYLLAHAIPLLFKLKRIRKEELWKFLRGLANSLVFAGLSSAIVRRVICLLTKYSSYNYTIARYPATIAGVSIFFESPGRQAEIALYCVSKGWEAAYTMLRRRHYPVSVAWGNLWLNAISMAVVAFAFLNDASIFREGYRSALGLIFSDI